MSLSRREFLLAGGTAGAGLVLGLRLFAAEEPAFPHRIEGAFQPNAFLQITPSGRIVLQIHKTEMGQGILTGLTTLVAEELNVPPPRIETEFAGIHPDYLNPQFGLQVTNASSSIVTCFVALREAAAAARALLLEAAAQTWQLEPASLDLEDGFVIERSGPHRAGIGEFAALAATLHVPQRPAVKAKEDFRYIGKFDRRLDSAAKVCGAALFGIDVALPDALTAVVVRCPQFGGTLRSFDDSAARAAPGIVDIFAIERGVAVVASGYWQARRAADALHVEWNVEEATQETSADIDREQSRRLDTRAAEDPPFAGDEVLDAEYSAPFQAHACMEPINATAAVEAGHVEIHVSTQAPDIVQAAVAQALGRPLEQVIVRSMLAGGGFGLRVYPFAAVEAATIAAQVGRPVKVIWSREDDMRHDLYRPAAKCRMSAALTPSGVARWRYRICAPSLQATLLRGIRARLYPATLPDEEFERILAAASRADVENLAGAVDTPYMLGEADIGQVIWEPGIPVSYWRSVGHSFNGFFVEGFIDELAHHAGADAVEFRRAHLDPTSRARRVLDAVVEASNWGGAAPGVHQGVAIDAIKGTVCGQVAEVEVVNRTIRVRRIVCAVDAGMLINPDIARMQVESCIVFGLTAALKSEVTIADRAVLQRNFDDFPLLRIDEAPAMDIRFMDSTDQPAGIGECAVAPVAPAVANAVFRATGRRLRSLPLRL